MSAYTRILIKLSGEVLQGDASHGINDTALATIVKEIVSIHNDGVEIAIVVGGGNFFRGASAVAAHMNRSDADTIGMLATIQNSIALKDKFRYFNIGAEILTSRPFASIGNVFTTDRAQAALLKNKIVILGGGTGNPYFTTDTAAVLRALEINADIVLKGTKVDGIYDCDPVTNPRARFIKNISFHNYLKQELRVMDLTAISLAMDHKLPIKIFNICTPGNIRAAAFDDQCGSVIG